MISHAAEMIAVYYEKGVLDSCDPETCKRIVHQDFLRFSMTLPDTVAITRDHPGSNALILRGVEADSDLRAKISDIANQIAQRKRRGCRIVRIEICTENSTSEVDSNITLSKRPRTTRPLPAANHKAGGFAAFRVNSTKGPRGSGSTSAVASTSTSAKTFDEGQMPSQPTRSIGIASSEPFPPHSLPGAVHGPAPDEPDDQVVSPTCSSSPSKPRGKKRKLDHIDQEQDKLQSDGDISDLVSEHDDVIISNPSSGGETESGETERKASQAEIHVTTGSQEYRNTEINDRVRSLLRAALAKAVEGEQGRLRVEADLRQQIVSLEGTLEQERADHNVSKRRIHDLEQGLVLATSSIERTNELVQATTSQLLGVSHEIGSEKA